MMKSFALLLGRTVANLTGRIVGGEKDNPEYRPNAPRDGILLEDIQIDSKHLTSGKGIFSIYLPREYDRSRQRYPVLYLLHGMGDDNGKWERKGCICSLVDKAVRDGVLPPFVAVMPKGWLSFYVNGLDLFDGEKGNHYERFFSEELQPYVEAHYPVLTDKGHTAIAGMSMGGYGASIYGFRHPEKYCLCWSMSGATEGLNWTRFTDAVPSVAEVIEASEVFNSTGLGNGQESKNGQMSAPSGQADAGGLPEYVMECGTFDLLCRKFNKKSHRSLEKLGIPHTFRMLPGSHNWSFWQGSIRRMFQELAIHFGK